MELIINNAKQEVKKIIDSLPDDTSYDEILKELAFGRMIQRGLKDSDENKTISNEDMKNKINQLGVNSSPVLSEILLLEVHDV